MSQGGQPHPNQVPLLTEVIELLPPTPVADAGMNQAPRPQAPEQGTHAAMPIITGGLPSAVASEPWAPMTTVVVPGLESARKPHVVSVADLPVLNAVVPVEALSAVPVPLAEPPAPSISEAQLAQRVLGDVQRQIDGMLDFRLREAIGPVLARHSEALVRELREELNRTMRDVVARSVAQEMAKLRQR